MGANAGSSMPDQEIAIDGRVRLNKCTLVKNGYNFKGWSEHIGSTEVKYPDEAYYTMGQDNVSLYAVWELSTFTIGYDLNGGVASATYPTTYQITTATINISDPTRAGYDFVGWTGSGITTPQKGLTIPTGSYGNLSYQAQWEARTNQIRFSPNSSTATGVMNTMGVKSDATTTLLPCQYQNPGYKFMGWAESDNGPVKYEDGASYKMGLESQYYLYAVWEIANYTITYNLYGGTVASANPTSYTVNTASVTITNPTREGYDFAGWTGTGIENPVMDISFVPGIANGNYGNRSYIANWDPKQYTIKYYKNYPGKDDTTDEQRSDTAYTGTSYQLFANTFVYEGYKFAGWATERGSSTIVYTASQVIEYPPNDMKLYAVWNSSYVVQLNDAGTGYYIKAVSNQEEYMTIPVFYWDGKPIIGIMKDAFNGKSTILSLTIVHDDTGARTEFTIGENAFINCYNMTSIVIPEEVTEIGSGAFNSCRNLVSISFAATNSNISTNGRYQFVGNCIIDTQYEITGGGTARAIVAGFSNSTIATDLNITIIAKKAFKGMSLLRNISFPTVTTLTIEEEAFNGCSSLEAINIPANVARIKSNAFNGCSGAKTLYFESTNSGSLEIESYAFKGCQSIESIEIPEQCVTVHPYSFSGCKGLTTISVNSNNVGGYFSRDDAIGVDFNAIVIKNGNNDNVLVVGCKGTVIKSQINIIGEGAFHNMGQIQLTSFSNNLKEIGNYAFYNCTFNIKTISTTNNVTNIGESAFERTNLQNVTINAKVTTIGSNAFNYCTAIVAINCPCTEANKPAGWASDWYGNVSANKIVWLTA